MSGQCCQHLAVFSDTHNSCITDGICITDRLDVTLHLLGYAVRCIGIPTPYAAALQ